MSYYFTTHDRPLVIDANTYLASELVAVTAMQKTASLDANNVELIGKQGLITGDFVTNNGLVGKDILVMKGVDWRSLPANTDAHPIAFKQVGIIGESTVEGQTTWKIQVQSKIERLLNQSPIRVTSPLCSHSFCDVSGNNSYCGLSSANYTSTTTISNISSQTQFQLVGTTDDYSYGTITFVDGPNAGLVFSITDGTAGLIRLAEVPEGLISDGQTVVAFKGCAKTEEDCRNRYGNFLQFNGIPAGGGWMPGNEKYQNPPIVR